MVLRPKTSWTQNQLDGIKLILDANQYCVELKVSPELITVSLVVIDDNDFAVNLARLERDCHNTNITSYPPTTGAGLTPKQGEKVKNALKSALIIYIPTFVGGSTVTGVFNQNVFQTSTQLLIDALMKGAVIAIPATIVAYFRKCNS